MNIEIYFDDVNSMKNWINKCSEKELFGDNDRYDLIDSDKHHNPEAIYVTKIGKKHKFKIPKNYEIFIENYTDENLKRIKRDNILKNTDWLFISDTPIPTKHRTYYKKYRDYLRKVNLKLDADIEPFEKWLRRNEPQEYQDGGNGELIVKRFYYYIEKKYV